MKVAICYHGTTREKAKQILANGFKPDCWFARHIEDAVAFGGEIIFAVSFEKRKIPRGWQFHHLEAYPASNIEYIFEVITRAKP